MATVVGKDSQLMRRCTCQMCTSIVEFIPNEIQEKSVSDYTGDRETVYFINCPGCGNQISVSKYANKPRYY